MKALALDFDGVISQSAGEAFAVARRAYCGLRPEGALASLQTAPEALYPGFVELMPLGNRAEDYAVVLAALEQQQPLPDQAAYDAFRERQDPVFLASFHQRFYAERHAWLELDGVGWRQELAPYPEVIDLLLRRAGHVELAIATAKDARSVRLLLEDYGISGLFPEDRLLDKETGVSKRAHLQQLLALLGVEAAELTFIDDKLNHLRDVASLGVRCALAAWGYNGEREQREAQRAGFLVCSLEAVEGQLFG